MKTVFFDGRFLKIPGVRIIQATSRVRNEINMLRPKSDVVRTMGTTKPNGLPYQPRPFPAGKWKITGASRQSYDSMYWPIFVSTNAIRELPQWELDEKGQYLKPTVYKFFDQGLGIHHARYIKNGKIMTSSTTHGCINISNPDDAMWFGLWALENLKEGIELEVSYDV